MQHENLFKIYSEVKNTQNSNDLDFIHGNVLMLKSLLTHSKEETFTNEFIDISKYILSKKDVKNSSIQLAVIETIPILSKFGKGTFVLEFLDPAIK